MIERKILNFSASGIITPNYLLSIYLHLIIVAIFMPIESGFPKKEISYCYLRQITATNIDRFLAAKNTIFFIMKNDVSL